MQRPFDQNQRLVVASQVRERLGQVVQHRHGVRIAAERRTQYGLRLGECPGGVVAVCKADAGPGIVRPAFEEAGIRGDAVARTAHPVHRGDRGQVGRLGGSHRNAAGRHGEHGPVVALLPAIFENRERDRAPLGFARAQVQLAGRIVETNHHRVMPDGHRTQSVVQQHDHGVTRRNLAQQVIEARRQLVRNPAMAARRGQHFDLQAALARRQVHAFDKIVRSDVHACVDQCGRQRRRAALVVELRIKRHRANFSLPRDPRRPGFAQSHGLRHH